MKGGLKKMEKKKIDDLDDDFVGVMPPRMPERFEHKDLKLLSEANGKTLLQSITTGKIYAVVQTFNFSHEADGFRLEELKSSEY